MFLCSILTLKVLPTLSNMLSSGTYLLASAWLLPAVRLVGLLQARVWISHQLPLALTSLRERCFLVVPTTPYTQYPSVKWRISFVISLLALTVMVWTWAHSFSEESQVCSLKSLPVTFIASHLPLLLFRSFPTIPGSSFLPCDPPSQEIPYTKFK